MVRPHGSLTGSDMPFAAHERLVAIEFQGFRYGNAFVVYVTLIFWKFKVRGIHVAHARVPLVLAREQTGARGAATEVL